MSANDRDAGLAGLVCATLEDATEHIKRNFFGGETNNVQGKQRPAPHGIDVADRIGGSNLSVIVRVVDNRCDEIKCLEDGVPRVQTISGCVVRGRSSDEDGRIGDRGKVAQDLSQVLGTELAGSAAAGGHLGEFDLLSHGNRLEETLASPNVLAEWQGWAGR